jgi:hypothetical protein
MKILLLGAKSQTAPLDSVPAELNRIKQLFTSSQQTLAVEYEPYLSRNILGDILRRLTDQLRIIHFAGHSNAAQLQTDQEAVYAQHIASLLETWTQKPDLLFLNGCNNAGQVRDFHKAGIACVIATQNPINDAEAARFAYEFYANLLAQPDKTTYQQAFDRAGALTLMDQRRSPRSFVLDELDADTNDAAWDWGIYPAPGQDSFLQTTLFPAVSPADAVGSSFPNPMLHIYQTKLDNAQQRWTLISDWLVRVLKQYDTETREAEKIRMEDGIQEKQAELTKVEAEMLELTEKLNSLSNP